VYSGRVTGVSTKRSAAVNSDADTERLFVAKSSFIVPNKFNDSDRKLIRDIREREYFFLSFASPAEIFYAYSQTTSYYL